MIYDFAVTIPKARFEILFHVDDIIEFISNWLPSFQFCSFIRNKIQTIYLAHNTDLFLKLPQSVTLKYIYQCLLNHVYTHMDDEQWRTQKKGGLTGIPPPPLYYYLFNFYIHIKFQLQLTNNKGQIHIIRQQISYKPTSRVNKKKIIDRS